MLYPETSPSAPVTRDDLAEILALQVRANAQNDYDPGGEDSMGGGYATTVSGFTPTGRDTSEASQASQGRDAAAMAAAAQAAGRDFASNTQGNAITGPLSGPGFGTGYGSTFGTSLTEAAPSTSTPTFGTPSEPALTEGLGGKGDRGYSPGTYTPDFGRTFSEADRATPTFGGAILGPTTAIPGVPSFPDWTPGDVPVGAPPAGPTVIGTVNPSGYTQPGAPSDPDNSPSTPGSDYSPAGFSGPGGFGAFGGGAATGGYEGSASMGNTTGAQGFTAGGGGYGDFGAASPGTGGTSAGGGAVGGFGGGSSAGDNSSDGGDSSGDNSGGSGDGVGGVG